MRPLQRPNNRGSQRVSLRGCELRGRYCRGWAVVGARNVRILGVSFASSVQPRPPLVNRVLIFDAETSGILGSQYRCRWNLDPTGRCFVAGICFQWQFANILQLLIEFPGLSWRSRVERSFATEVFLYEREFYVRHLDTEQTIRTSNSDGNCCRSCIFR